MLSVVASLVRPVAMSEVSQVSIFVAYDGVPTVLRVCGDDVHDENCDVFLRLVHGWPESSISLCSAPGQ